MNFSQFYSKYSVIVVQDFIVTNLSCFEADEHTALVDGRLYKHLFLLFVLNIDLNWDAWKVFWHE